MIIVSNHLIVGWPTHSSYCSGPKKSSQWNSSPPPLARILPFASFLIIIPLDNHLYLFRTPLDIPSPPPPPTPPSFPPPSFSPSPCASNTAQSPWRDLVSHHLQKFSIFPARGRTSFYFGIFVSGRQVTPGRVRGRGPQNLGTPRFSGK